MNDLDTEVLKKINSIIQCHHLTGRALGDSCTDGYDVEYTLLSMKILKTMKEKYGVE